MSISVELLAICVLVEHQLRIQLRLPRAFSLRIFNSYQEVETLISAIWATVKQYFPSVVITYTYTDQYCNMNRDLGE